MNYPKELCPGLAYGIQHSQGVANSERDAVKELPMGKQIQVDFREAKLRHLDGHLVKLIVVVAGPAVYHSRCLLRLLCFAMHDK